MKTNIVKALGYVAAAEILSLFIGLTLAGSSSTAIRFVSAVCTTGIIICLMANFAANCAGEELRRSRTDGTALSFGKAFAVGGVTSAPALISWVVLLVSKTTGAFDFYRWHKLLNGCFLQIYNFINSNASTGALTNAQIMLMLPLVLIPALSYIIAYYLVIGGVIPPPKNR